MADFNELLDAACDKDLSQFKQLFANGADVNSVSEMGDSLFSETVCWLCSHGDNPEVLSPHRYDNVGELLKLGANPNFVVAENCRPLFYGILAMDTDMIRLTTVSPCILAVSARRLSINSGRLPFFCRAA